MATTVKSTLKRKIGRITTLSLIILTIITGCGGANSVNQGSEKVPGANAAKDNPTIKIGYVSILSMAPAIIAKEQKLMEKSGLNAEYYSFANGPDLYKAFASGKLDFAYAGVPAGINWASRGAKIKAIAKVGDGKFGLMTASNSAITNAADLKGKKLGTIVKGSGVDLLVRGFLLPEGNLDKTSVKLVETKMANMEAAIKNQLLDAAVAGEPFLTAAELHGLKVVKEMRDPAIIVLTSNAYIQNHRELVEKFLQGHSAAVDFIQQNAAQSAGLLAKAFNAAQVESNGKTFTPQEVIEKALNRQHYDIHFSDDDFNFYKQIADANLRLKLIDKPFDVQTLFDTSFLDK